MRSVQVQSKSLSTSPPPPSSTSQPFIHLTDETIKFISQLPPLPALNTSSGNSTASSSSGSDAPSDPLLFQGRENEQNQSNALGYDFSFINTPLDEDLICVICSLVCRDAVETSCSHIFCSSCLQRWLKQKNECVTCRSALSRSDVHASGFIRRKILGLKVKCVNSAACDWTGELRYMSSHLRKECQMQKLIHATNHFVESNPPQNAVGSSLPNPYATSSSSTSSSSSNTTTTIGGRIPSEVLISLSEQIPMHILRSLPAAALNRLLSLHSFHSLARDESHPLFNLSNSCVMTPYYRSSTSNTFTSPDQTWFSPSHLQCSSNCLLPPPVPSPSPDAADLLASSEEHSDSSQRRELLAKQLHDILAARRAQFMDLFKRLTSFFQGAPVKVLQNFLASKGVNMEKGALEKSELVAECMAVRNQPDQEEYRKKVGASPLKGFGDASSLDNDRDYFGSTGYRAAAPNNRSNDGGAFAAALDEAGLDLMTQLHLAALEAHSNAHQHQNPGSAAVNSAIMNAHFQAHALHAAQHMLGFNSSGGAGGGAGISMQARGLGNGVVISMRMGSNGSMHVSSFDRNSDVVEAERRAREEQQQARIRRAEEEVQRQVERREREREMALRDRGSAAGSSSSLDGSGLNRANSHVSSNVLFQRGNSNSGIAPDGNNNHNLPAGAASQSSNRNARRYSRENKNSNQQQPPHTPTSCCTIM